jgi:hypothetical protein
VVVFVGFTPEQFGAVQQSAYSQAIQNAISGESELE